MTLEEALIAIGTVNFKEAKPKQFSDISTFLEGAIDEIANREREVTKRERSVSERESAVSLREFNVDAREQSLNSIERLKPRLKFWQRPSEARGHAG